MPSRILTLSAALLLLSCGGESHAPYLGTWHPNESSTDISNFTIRYAAVDAGGYEVTVDGQTFMMPVDGSEIDSPWGGTMAVRTLDSLSWETTSRMGGAVIGTDTMWMAADGQTLSSRSHRTMPNGEVQVSEMQMTRVDGGPGLAGTWRGSSMSGAMLGALEIAAAGDSGLAISYEGMQATCTPTFDGRDAPARSPMFGDDWTCAVATDTDGGFTLTWKRAGESRYVSRYSVSASGDSLTEVSTAAEVDEPVTVVYTRGAAEH